MKLEMVWPGRGHAIGTLVIPAKTKGIGLQLRSHWAFGHWAGPQNHGHNSRTYGLPADRPGRHDHDTGGRPYHGPAVVGGGPTIHIWEPKTLEPSSRQVLVNATCLMVHAASLTAQGIIRGTIHACGTRALSGRLIVRQCSRWTHCCSVGQAVAFRLRLVSAYTLHLRKTCVNAVWTDVLASGKG